MCVCVRAQKAAVLANERLSNVLEVFDEGWNEFLLTAIVKNVDPDVRDVAPNGHHHCK